MNTLRWIIIANAHTNQKENRPQYSRETLIIANAKTAVKNVNVAQERDTDRCMRMHRMKTNEKTSRDATASPT